LVQSVKGETERNAIASALDQAGWNRKAAARLLQVSYRTLLYKIEQYGMSPPVPQFSHAPGGFSRERGFAKASKTAPRDWEKEHLSI
ncbi:MAG: helix-turn-helix domain-containing protein, partial [Terriglobales bacterium]